MNKILVVDDQEEGRYLLEHLLKVNGFEVVSASNGREALAMVHAERPLIIISDILMPEMDGFTLCRAVKSDEALRSIPFVFYSATYTTSEDEKLALSLGAARFIRRPQEPAAFIAEIREVVSEAATAGFVAQEVPALAEPEYLKLYNERLVRKLEEKMLQLEHAHQRLTTLYRASASLASIKSPEKLVSYALQSVTETMGYGRANYFAFDAENQEFRLLAAVGFSDQMTEMFRQELVLRLGEERGLVGLVGQTRQPLIVPDTQNDPRWITLDGTIRAALFVPVIHEGSLLGVMGFLSTETGAFDENDVRNAMTLAYSLATAIENARLYERMQQLAIFNQSIVQSMAEGIAVEDAEGYFTFVNPAAEAMLGYEPGELIGQHWTAIIPPDQQPIVHAADERRRHGVSDRYELELVRKDGSRLPVLVSGSPRFENGRFTGTLAVFADISELKRLESQLIQSQKMEALGRLAGGVAHDFNNLLTAIIGYSEFLLQELNPYDPRRGDVEEIKKAANRAAALTRQLLAFSRKQMLQPQVLNLNTTVSNLEKMLRRLIGEDIELVTVLDPHLGRVKADPGQIEQVIMNLAVNTRDAMPQGGKLTIETRDVLLDEDYARQYADVQPGSYVMLTMSDTGTGMDEETLSHLFEPFFTTKDVGQGTGLGLATVHGIVKQSGGHITVYSEPGLGTTFKIYLPQTEEASTTTSLPLTRPAALQGQETILLVEDADMVRDLARRTLTFRGYTVLEAHDGEEALRLSTQHEGPIHLLVTDVVMPGGISGRQLAERLMATRPEMRVLYMSGYADDAIVRHGLLEPGMAFLQKPFAPDILALKVREVLDAV